MDIKKIGFGLAAFAGGALAWVAGTAAFGPKPARPARPAGPGRDADTAPAAEPARRAATNPAAEHVPTDLMGDAHPGSDSRPPEAFRPDPTAVPTAEEREALRPATGPAPSMVAERGSGFAEAAGAA